MIDKETGLAKILHVDDDEHFLEMFRFMFRKNFQVISAENGNIAVELLLRESFDLAILDFEMPGMNGLELLNMIKGEKPGLPVIFYTGQGNERVAREAFIQGAFDYFTKDIHGLAHREKLLNSFNRAIEARKTEIERKKSEKKFRNLFENANDAIYLLRNGRFTDCNRKAMELFGADREKIIGSCPCKFSPPFQPDGRDSREKMTGYLCSTASGSSHMFEWIFKNARGEFYYTDVSLNHLELECEDYVQAIVRDVSERKKMEKERLTHIRFLEETEKIDLVIRRTNDLNEMMDRMLQELLSIFKCDRAWLIFPCDPDSPCWNVPMERTVPEYPGALSESEIFSMSPETAEVFRMNLEEDGPVCYDPKTGLIPPDSARKYGVKSQMLLAIYPRIDKPWLLGIHQCSRERIWSEEERSLFKEIGNRVTDSLNTLLLLRNLRESEKSYRFLVENMNDGIASINKDYIVTYVNPRMAEMLGYSPEEMIGRNVREFLDNTNREVMISQVELRKKGGHNIYRMEWLAKSGNNVPTLLSPRAIFDREGNYTGSFAVITDITQRRQMEKALQTTLKILEQERRMFVNGPVVVFKWRNEEGWPVEYVTKNVKDVLGYNANEFLNGMLPYAKIIHPEDLERVAGEVELNSEGAVENFRHEPYQVIREDGSIIWVADYATILRNEAGEITHYLGYILDITENIKAEKQLKAINRELDDFTHIVSHDLKSPVNLIVGYIETLKSNPDRSEDIFKRIVKISENMIELIDNLLSLSRAGRAIGSRKKVNLEDKIRTIFMSNKPENVPSELIFLNEPPEVMADPMSMGQVFLNLIQNSFQCRDTNKEKLILKISGERDERLAVIKYQDNGTGIPAEAEEMIFNPGISLRKNKGTGLGLPIVRKIINAHGGKILAKSRGENQGVEFYIELPVS